MTICPIAVVAGCKKCPAFSMCPLKSVLGDQGDSQNTATKPDGESKNSGTERDE